MASGHVIDASRCSLNMQLYHQFIKLNLPRQPSDLAVPFWNFDLDERIYSNSLREIARTRKRTSLYVHGTLCERRCHDYGCNKLVISRDHAEARTFANRYIESLEQELNWVETQAAEFFWNVQ